jgi:hypothetical protein
MRERRSPASRFGRLLSAARLNRKRAGEGEVGEETDPPPGGAVPLRPRRSRASCAAAAAPAKQPARSPTRSSSPPATSSSNTSPTRSSAPTASTGAPATSARDGSSANSSNSATRSPSNHSPHSAARSRHSPKQPPLRSIFTLKATPGDLARGKPRAAGGREGSVRGGAKWSGWRSASSWSAQCKQV